MKISSGPERDLIPVITRLSRQSKNIDEAIELFQSALSGKIGDATLFVDLTEQGMSPELAKSTAALMDSRQFPFRGLYTAPLTIGSRKVGRMIACFGTFGVPGSSLSAITAHIAAQFSGILARTTRAVSSLVIAGSPLDLTAYREAAL